MTTVLVPLKHGVMKIDFNDWINLPKSLFSVINKKKECSENANIYVKSFDGGKLVYIHRLLMNAPKGYVVDHINGNSLDNRRKNLRICTSVENSRNSKMPISNKAHTKFKGVHKDRGKWIYARIKFNGKNIRKYGFKTEREAAEWYNQKAIELFGEFANLNKFES